MYNISSYAVIVHGKWEHKKFYGGGDGLLLFSYALDTRGGVKKDRKSKTSLAPAPASADLSKTLPLKVFCDSKEPARRLQHSIVGPPPHLPPHNLSRLRVNFYFGHIILPTSASQTQNA